MAENEAPDFLTVPQPNGEDAAPQVGMLAQYVKDFSFENPNAPAVYNWQNQPQIDVQFNIGTQQIADDVHESAVRIEITATAPEGVAFKLELLYGGLFALQNVPADALQPFLLGEAPRVASQNFPSYSAPREIWASPPINSLKISPKILLV